MFSTYSHSIKQLFLERRRHWFTLMSLAGAQVLVLIFGLASNSLMARYLPVEVFGQYQVILSLMALVGAYCLTGLQQSMAISAARRFDGNIYPILRLRLGAGLIGALVVAGVGVYYIYSGQAVLGWGVLIASLFFPFRLELIWTSWLNGRNKLRLSAFSKSAIVAIGLLTTLIVIWLPPITLNKTIFWFFSLPAVYTAGLIVYILRSKENDIYDRQTIKYGLQVTGASLLGGLVAADKLLLNEYLTVTDVAVYSIALIFPQQIKKLFDIFDQFLTPSIYKAKSIGQAWKYLRVKFVLISLIFIGIGLVGYFILPVLIPLFFSEQYSDAVPYTRWLWLIFSLSMPPLYLSNILKAQQKVRFIYISSIGSPLTRVVFYIVLLPLGIWGIVLATIVNYVTNGLFMIGSFVYYLMKERRELMD